MYLQDIVSSGILASALFSFFTVFFNTIDDIGIGGRFSCQSQLLLTPQHNVKLPEFYSEQMQPRCSEQWGELEKERREWGSCGFKTCHQANYVFMKEVEQISG